MLPMFAYNPHNSLIGQYPQLTQDRPRKLSNYPHLESK